MRRIDLELEKDVTHTNASQFKKYSEFLKYFSHFLYLRNFRQHF